MAERVSVNINSLTFAKVRRRLQLLYIYRPFLTVTFATSRSLRLKPPLRCGHRCGHIQSERMMGKLTVRGVGAAKAGKYGDGSGLYLFVTENGAKRWVFRYKRNGASTSREMGLGSIADVGLAEAREKAANARKAVREGRDPIAERTRTSNVPNFGNWRSEVHESRSTGFRNKKHAAQWISTLRTDAAPLLAMPVDTIGTHDVLGVLQPIWKKKSETASRVRGRIEAVLDYAKAKGLRDGENPARWRGHLNQLLPKRPKLTRGHHAAMPHEQVAHSSAACEKATGSPRELLNFAS